VIHITASTFYSQVAKLFDLPSYSGPCLEQTLPYVNVEICPGQRSYFTANLHDLEELHRLDSDVVLDDTVDHSAGAQLFTVNALGRVYHSAALVDRKVVPVEERRRSEKAEAQPVDDWRIIATIKAQLGDQVADETVGRKFLDDEELTDV